MVVLFVIVVIAVIIVGAFLMYHNRFVKALSLIHICLMTEVTDAAKDWLADKGYEPQDVYKRQEKDPACAV